MIPKSKIVEHFCAVNTIIYTDIVYFDDLREQTRHCCLDYPGILSLPLERKSVMINGYNIVVPHFFCRRCRKLLVYRDFI